MELLRLAFFVYIYNFICMYMYNVQSVLSIHPSFASPCNSPLLEEKPDLEVGMGLANKLEEMRKEGGDAWLSIWNADSTKVS